jgi:hypothetical protein
LCLRPEPQPLTFEELPSTIKDARGERQGKELGS